MPASLPPDPIEYRELLANNRLITSSLDHVVVLATVTRQAAQLLKADAAVLLLRDNGSLHVVASHGLPAGTQELRVEVGPGVMNAIREIGSSSALPGFVGVPLVLHEETVGILAIYRRHDGVPHPNDEELLSAMADQAAIALENARVHEQLKLQARALGESEERFRLALDEAPNGVALVGLDGRFLRVNNALCDMLGYTSHELTQQTFFAITHPDDLDLDVALAEQLARGDIPRYQLEKRYIRKDGTIVSAVLSGSIVRRPDRSPLYYVAHVEDITERKQAAERLELALDAAELAAWDWNIVTGQVAFSPRWFEMRGYRPDEIPSEVSSWRTGIHPDDLPLVERSLDEHFRNLTATYETEFRVRTKYGGWIWILDRGKVIARDEAQRPIRMVGTELDVTARKGVERERALWLERLATVLEEAPVAILMTHDGLNWQGNGRAGALWGERLDSPFDPSPYFDALVDVEGKRIADSELPGARALRGEELDSVEMCVRRPDQSLVPVLVNAAPIRFHSDVAGAVLAFEDITSLKELERLRSEWSSVIAHDLRQPLNSILLYTDLLGRAAERDPEIRKRAGQIRDGILRVDRMIHDLMDFSRLEARRLKLHRQTCDLREPIEDVAERFRLEFPDRLISVASRGGAALVSVDTDRFQQVMENLLSNAVKYGAPGSPIHIDVVAKPDAVSVAVTNHGPGIPPEQLPLLFQRFFTGAQPGKRAIKSIGLGLNITRGLVEAHGGEIFVESRVGDTTTFRFVLPAIARGTSPEAHP